MDLHDYVRRRLAEDPPGGAHDRGVDPELPDPELIDELAQHLGDLITRRARLREIDSQLVVARPRTLADEFSRSVGDQTLMATLVSLFGALALLLAAIGLYGTMAHAVGQRRTEIGIRLALGASPRTILRMMVGDGLRLVSIGAFLGLGAAIAVSRAIEQQLFGVRPLDPATYAGVAIVLVAVAVTACVVPARRAMRVDPVVALKHG